MKVVIAGGGSVGRFIAQQLHGEGHEVRILDSDHKIVSQFVRAGEPAGVDWLEIDACEVTALGRRRSRRRRCHRRGDGRRRGQPRHLAAGEAGVRCAARRRQGQQPEERVDVQRAVGRRRERVDTAPADGPRRGSRERRLVHPAAQLRGGRAKLAEVTLADDSPAHDQHDRRARPSS
ncbi:MAG: NAD-binding protein [Ilumatobacteraceae bacterium]